MLQNGLGLKEYSDEQCPYQKIPGQEPAQGAFAKVYNAISRNYSGPQQFFALKEIVMKNEDWLEYVKEEIKILKPLRHPNILVLEEAFYSKLEPRKVSLATMPWAPQTLFNFFWNVQKTDRLDGYKWYVPGNLDQWPSIVLQCSRGLAYLHNSKIKHKDLKPHNILLLQEKDTVGKIRIRPIIADFGLSKSFVPGGKTDGRGTPEFQAPEQFLPDQVSELHSDIWSLGCCFAFVWILLLSGKEGLADFWKMIMWSKRHERHERGFHTERNRKATHELLKQSFTRSRDSRMIVFMQDFGALVKNMLDVKTSERPEAWNMTFRLIRLERRVETQLRKEAEELKVQLMESSKRAPGQENSDRLTSMTDFESTLSNQAPWKKAEGITIAGVPNQKQLNLLSRMANLGSKSWDQIQMEDADKLYAQVMQTREKALEQVDPSEFNTMANLALIFWSQGRLEEAESLYVEVMEKRRMVLGREDRSTLDTMAVLVSFYWFLERFEEVELLSLPLVEMRERVLGQEHPLTLAGMNGLATLWMIQGYHDKALQILNEFFERSKKLGPNNYYTFYSEAKLNSWREEKSRVEPISPESPDEHASSE